MTSRETPRSAARAVAVTVVLSSGLATGAMVTRLLVGVLPIRYEIAGAIALSAVLAVAPTSVLFALRGRNTLFLPASLIALAKSPNQSQLVRRPGVDPFHD